MLHHDKLQSWIFNKIVILELISTTSLSLPCQRKHQSGLNKALQRSGMRPAEILIKIKTVTGVEGIMRHCIAAVSGQCNKDIKDLPRAQRFVFMA